MNWQRALIHSRPADVLDPSTGTPDRAILFLHGYRGETLQHSQRFTSLLQRHNVPVVCPHGGPHWWTSLPTPGFEPFASPQEFLVNGVVPWMADRWHVAPPRIALLGISMGGQGALQLSYRQPAQFPVVAAISPAIDFHLTHGKGFGVEQLYPTADAARQATVTLNLHPLNWPRHQYFCCDPTDVTWYDGAQRLASKLSSSGIPFSSDLFSSHGGHNWNYFDAMAEGVIEWMLKRQDEVET